MMHRTRACFFKAKGGRGALLAGMALAAIVVRVYATEVQRGKLACISEGAGAAPWWEWR